jgi:signal peptidase I
MRRYRTAALGLIATGIGYAALRGRLRRYEIVERSMAPALEPGDYVVAVPAGTPARGQIVVLPHPAIARFELVKRIVGLPGEAIVIRNGQVHVDGAVLAERWADGPTRPDGEWRLAADEVFLLGDNRSFSAADSRTLGPIPTGSLAWRVAARYWPLRSAGRITTGA